ncbi:hypothetical protein M434DRAFT_16201 [Hypoxylon sp. CO27-5]|nr:hypothetical protein M434DRAFT_16201 [Hypoxylon sp. CO27-5]
MFSNDTSGITLSQLNAQAKPSSISINYKGEDHTFYYLDTVEVTYESNLSRPWISTWCQVDGVPQEKDRIKVYNSNSSVFIQLRFKHGTPCWMKLHSNDRNNSQEANSPTFDYVATERRQTTITTDQPSSTSTAIANSIPSVMPQATINPSSANGTEVDSSVTESGSSETSDMDRTHVGIVIGAAVGGIVLGASVSIIFFQYSRRRPEIKTNTHENGTRRRSCGISYSLRNYPTTSHLQGPDTASRSHTAYRGEVSPIYPDESASCFHPETSYRLTKAYATDFAVADRQIWTDHLQSSSSRESGVTPGKKAPN